MENHKQIEGKMTLKKYFSSLIFCILTLSSYSQDTTLIISRLDEELYNKRKKISDVLTDSTLMYLHSLTSFREIIKRNATAEAIAIVAEKEPGLRIIVNGTVINSSGKPLVSVLVYFYQTSDKGWYSDTAVHIKKYEGDHRHSRLFGYVKTDSLGKFRIKTIRPNGYPKSSFAGHIHIQMWQEDGTFLLGIPGELQFDDDIRMTDERRHQSLSEGFLIAKNEGIKEMPIYNYLIKSKGK